LRREPDDALSFYKSHRTRCAATPWPPSSVPRHDMRSGRLPANNMVKNFVRPVTPLTGVCRQPSLNDPVQMEGLAMWWVIASLVSVASLAGLVAAARLMEPTCCRDPRHQQPFGMRLRKARRVRYKIQMPRHTKDTTDRQVLPRAWEGDRGCVT
jgi:hypothetical protein